MNKIFSFVFAVAFVTVGFASTASAAMPNYIGDDYKQAADCIPFVDHMVYEIVNGAATVTGCITPEAWDRSIAEAKDLQATGAFYAAGEYITYLDGTVEQVPHWLNTGVRIWQHLVR